MKQHSMKDGGQHTILPNEPLVYQALPKIESEEEKISRYERVIDQLKKMVDSVRKQTKTTSF